jgi:hypothetical protein
MTLLLALLNLSGQAVNFERGIRVEEVAGINALGNPFSEWVYGGAYHGIIVTSNSALSYVI